jgi:MSHA pilin protein MshC
MFQSPIYPPCRLSGVGRRRAASVRGFTLIELIMVVVILGVLAVFAAPRLLRPSDFYVQGFHDETMAYLRFAQKTAVAQRRTVCVTFAASSLTLTIASAAATFDCATAGTLTGPKGETPVTLTAKSGMAYGTTPTNFYFDGLGQPITVGGGGAAQATQTFQVSGASKTITVETATGYVHE